MRSKNVILNSLAEVLPYFFIGVLGLIKMSVFADVFSSQLTDAYGFVNTVIGFFFVAEAGLTGAVVFHLYKPFSEDDQPRIRALFTGSIRIFRVLGAAILGLVLLFAIIMGIIPGAFAIDGAIYWQVILSFIIICIAYLIPSFGFSHTYSALFASSQQQYIYSIIFNVLRLVVDVLTIMLIRVYPNLYTVAWIILIVKIVEEIIVDVVGKKMFPWVYQVKKADMTPAKTTLDVTRNHIGGLIVKSVDVLVLQMIVRQEGFVTLYTYYLYLPTFIAATLTKINNAIAHALGHLFVTESKKRMLSLCTEYIVGIVIVAMSVSFAFLIGGRAFSVVMFGTHFFLRYSVIAAYSINLFILVAYMPLIYIINSVGLYKESRNFIFVAAVINIVLSVSAPFFFKEYMIITMIILATTVAYFATVFLRCRLIETNVFPMVPKNYFVNRYIKYILLFMVIVLISYPLEKFYVGLNMGLFTQIIVIGIVYFIGLGLSILLMYVIAPSTVKNLKRTIMNYLEQSRKNRMMSK